MTKTPGVELPEAKLVEVIQFRGHPLVRSSHPTTLEITTEDYLTENGDCIIGVAASKGCAQIDDGLKERLRVRDSRVTIRIVVGGRSFQLSARGDPRLGLSHPHDVVIRKSDFISDRTLAVRADASARDIPRDMVRALRRPETVGRLEVEVT